MLHYLFTPIHTTQADWNDAEKTINKRFQLGQISEESQKEAVKKLNTINKTTLPKDDAELAVVKSVENVSAVAKPFTPVDIYDKGVDMEKTIPEIQAWFEKLKKK